MWSIVHSKQRLGAFASLCLLVKDGEALIGSWPASILNFHLRMFLSLNALHAHGFMLHSKSEEFKIIEHVASIQSKCADEDPQ